MKRMFVLPQYVLFFVTRSICFAKEFCKRVQIPNLQTFISFVVEVKQCHKYSKLAYFGLTLWRFKILLTSKISVFPERAMQLYV